MGQYSGSKIFLKSIWNLEFNYNDLNIDWGNLWNFESISEEEYSSIEADNLSSQLFFRNLKSYPLINTTDFDGFTLTFSDVKVANVLIQSSPNEAMDKSVGGMFNARPSMEKLVNQKVTRLQNT